MGTQLSTANEELCAKLHDCVKWITTHLGHWQDRHAGASADFYNIPGGTLWYFDDTRWTQIVLNHQIVFEADPEGRASTFIEGPWIADVLALAKPMWEGAA